MSETSTKVTFDDVAKTLRDLAAENPERSNPTTVVDKWGKTDTACMYTNEHGEHCVAGEVIVRLGGRVPGYGEVGNQAGLTNLVGWYNDDAGRTFDFGIALDDDSVRLLNQAQVLADSDNTWGEVARSVLGGEF